MSDELKRRDLFRLTAGGLIAVGLVRGASPVFFTPDELSTVNELMETIIPTDDHSPGAKEAGCAAYVDRQLAESVDDESKSQWRAGLKALEAKSRSMFNVSIAQASAEQRIQLLTEISKNEENPKTDEEKFFNVLKFDTAFAYYSSDVGIHKEMNYKGNVYLPQFAGTRLS